MARWTMAILGIAVFGGCTRSEPVEPAPPQVHTVQKPIEPPLVIVLDDLPEVPEAIQGPSPPIVGKSDSAEEKQP